MTNSAAVLETVDHLDPFATDSTQVVASKLREGMVLMDPETGTPAVWLDHKMRTERGTGAVRWLAHDLDTGALTELRLRASLSLEVLAA